MSIATPDVSPAIARRAPARPIGASSRFLKLFIAPREPGATRFLVYSLVSQVAQVATIMLFMAVVDAHDVGANGIDLVMLGVMALLALVQAFTSERAQQLTVRIGVGVVERFAQRYAKLMRKADTTQLAALGPKIDVALARDSAVLVEQSAAIGKTVAVAMAVVLLVGCLVFVSPLVGLVIAVIFGVSITLQIHSWTRTRQAIAQASLGHKDVVASFDHLVLGSKEVRLEPRRGQDLERAIDGHLRRAGSADIHARDIQGRVIFQVVLLVTLAYACVAFVLPPFLHEHTTIIKAIILVTAIVRFVQLLANQVALLPVGEEALAGLETLERELAGFATPSEVAATVQRPAFATLSVQNLVYHFADRPGEAGFVLGPVSFDIQAGKVIFIAGPNGSGKSTLLRVLCAVYPKHRGQVLWDGSTVDGDHVATYRRLFAAVFADFHLFDRLYGYLDTDPERVHALLKRLGLDAKTRFADGRFSDVDLSTGQRKRLALASALIEDKPILLFDEVAADQDPTFREYFYKTLIPELKREGKTVIVVTHDERYFGCADQVLHMQDGHFETRRGQ